MTPPIRILLVDDHDIVREGWRAVLEQCADFQVIGEAASGGHAVQQAAHCAPQVVLMDINMPGMNGLDAARVLCVAAPQSRVLLATTFCTPAHVLGALAAGAHGCIGKDVAREDLFAALRAVALGHVWI